MKYIGTYSNDADIATKAKVDAKQDKVLANGILQGDGGGTISAAETQEVELVELTKADVGLGNVDNTSDTDKPISTATQTALNGKQATITGGASTITSSNLTANRALVSDANGKVAVSDVTSTELGYLDGVTSNIQTQLNGKLSSAPVTSVNSKTGAVELTASDVGAQPTITAKGFLKGDGNGNITADKPVFTVTITPTQADNSIGTADKTAAEIFAAYNAGYAIQAVYDDVITLQLTSIGVDADAIHIIFSTSMYQDGSGIGYGITYTDSSESWHIYQTEMVPTTRTINGKGLFTNITLNAADVNAVGLTGDQTIKGEKTFTGQVTFENNNGYAVSFESGISVSTAAATFSAPVSFMSTSAEYPNNLDVGVPSSFTKKATFNSIVDFSNATVSGLSGLLPTVSTSNNGQFLRVVNGAWAAATVENANGVSF